jgi:hemerythrin-like domain-containing protein
MGNGTGQEKPCGVLKAEHQVILRVIGVLGRLIGRSKAGEGFEVEALGRCVEFLRFFADACHHAKEEELLFPVLEERGIPRDGGPIGVMLHEHTIARGLTQAMADGLDAHAKGDGAGQNAVHVAAEQYIDLLTDHIYKEDNILFAMGDRCMTDQDQSSLGDKFCEVGCRAFGGKKREQLEQMADQLESEWPG